MISIANKWETVIQNTVKGIEAQDIILDKVIVNEAKNRLDVIFKSKVLLDIMQLNLISESMNNAFNNQAKINVKIDFINKKTNELDEKYLKKLILQLNKGFYPYIEYFEFEIDKEKIVILLPDIIVKNLWDMYNMTTLILEYISKIFEKKFDIVTEYVQASIDFNITQEQQVVNQQAPKPVQATEKPKQQRRIYYNQPKVKQDYKNKVKNTIFGKPSNYIPLSSINSLDEETGLTYIEGFLFKIDTFLHRDQKKFTVVFGITDYNDSISCKMFFPAQEIDELLSSLKKGAFLRIGGSPYIDTFRHELILKVSSIMELADIKRQDNEQDKRVELHLHTHMSASDGLLSIEDAVKTAARFGHSAVAVTDHGVVQSFPKFYSAAEKHGIKAIFGMEGYLLNDSRQVDINSEFVVFDLETTGLNEKQEQIIEIGAARIKDFKIVEKFQSFVNPHKKIPEKIVTLTGITNEMVDNAPEIQDVLKEFKEFCKDTVLVAHNASFDMKFLCEHGERYNIVFDNPAVDTLMVARYHLRDLDHHRLDDLTEYFNISLENHHRADDDAYATAEILLKLIEMQKGLGFDFLPASFAEHRQKVIQVAGKRGKQKAPTYHIIFLVKNQTGLENLYKLVTYSHLNHFKDHARIPRSLLEMHREGIIVGSACEAGELFKAVAAGKSEDELLGIAKMYDFLEIQPIGNNEFMIEKSNNELTHDDLRNYNKIIFDLANKLNKPCIATGDVHFNEPKDAFYRSVIMAGKGFKDADRQPPLFFKTTKEMLDEFAYLGKDNARKVVIENTKLIADQCQMLKPFPFETCQPLIEGAKEELVSSCFEKAHSIYGEELHPIVKERLDRELGSITKYGFEVLYVVARKLVIKSNADGYLVGSRGSVGSSIAAFMAGITEVNALPPHYVCPKCKHSDFEVDLTKYSCGCDMQDKNCPVCGTKYKKDGFSIPFETFLGFEGDKVPDIDLNFSGEYQPVAHKYTEEIFGKGYVFRAGTIGEIKEKTAYGYAKKYFEERGISARNIELERIAVGCSGVKRTTGQHPGGIVVLPKDRSIFEFTPLQRPADEPNSQVVTTHFDFNSMHDTLVKLDILGHVDPTIIKMMEDLTGIDAKTIPLDDPKTMSIFSSTDAIGVNEKDLRSPVATYGVPEFGTNFVRQMLVDTMPNTIEELLRISGLSHGTDVWLNNAQDLVRASVASLSQVICTRDDIMNYLILKGMDKKLAFTIMERVRKGKGLSEEMEIAMREADIEEWYIESCKKIKYMFPRAHAAAYVMMSFRSAFFKVHYPCAFYTAYFSVRSDLFDYELAFGGNNKVLQNIISIESKGKLASDKEKNALTILELVLEMNLRGITLAPIDLKKSDAMKFKMLDDKTILPPFFSLQGLGEKAAFSIVEARDSFTINTVEELKKYAGIGNSTIEILNSSGCLDGIPKESQISFFDNV